MKKFINWGFVGLGNASLNLAKEFEKLDNSNKKFKYTILSKQIIYIHITVKLNIFKN